MPDELTKLTETAERHDDDSGGGAAFAEGDEQTPIVKEAKIFEAGDYEDKGVTVTESDLDRFIQNHEPCPIQYEHVGGGLRFGTLTRIWRKGKELFGQLDFTPAGWAKAVEDGLRKLSVAFPKDKSRLLGVDLVMEPRVADAAVFAFSIGAPTVADTEPDDQPATPEGANAAAPTVDTDDQTATTDTESTEVTEMADEIKDQPKTEMSLAEAMRVIEEHNRLSADGDIARFTKEQLQLAKEARESLTATATELKAANAEFRAARAEMTIQDLKGKGFITPATEARWRAVFQQIPATGSPVGDTDCVTFADGDAEPARFHWAQFVLDTLKLNGPVIGFAELLKAEGDGVELTAEDRKAMAEFGLTEEDYRKYGKGVK